MQQAFLDRLRQGRSGNIEAQMDGAGNLVDVLPARTLSAHGGDLHFVEWNLD
ncbi:MAG: hypothetical protein ACD_10C00314G0001 [uncultured bacterium]|nr:MAG: hypothetical protein ACD_10C00314G0001 [uncultured bacterium]